jgi:hypothetical protein
MTLIAVIISEQDLPKKFWVLGSEVIITVLLWHRTRIRAEYFAEEVLQMCVVEKLEQLPPQINSKMT